MLVNEGRYLGKDIFSQLRFQDLLLYFHFASFSMHKELTSTVKSTFLVLAYSQLKMFFSKQWFSKSIFAEQSFSFLIERESVSSH